MEKKALPKFPFPRFIRNFVETETSTGIVMIAAAIMAMIAANTALYDPYKNLITTPISFSFGTMSVTEPLKQWVKDILMAIFFLHIGLELKREAVEGVLAKRDQILLPLVAAAGGMLFPALIYLYINQNHPENFSGWGIPTATDIAFAVCILILVARNIPNSVKIFLLAVAIFDDLGAILVIAIFYSGSLNLTALLLAGICVLLLYWLNRLKVILIMPYMIMGIFLWFAFYNSGISATVAGVVTGIMVPMRCSEHPKHSPVNVAAHALHPWVGFVILPIFAFVSAGISLKGISVADLLLPLPMGIALALFFGKQIGIFGVCYLASALKIVSKPFGASWLQIYGVSIIAGVGFTMSLFVGSLAFGEEMQNFVKIGVISGSIISTIWGAIVLSYASKLISKKNASKI